jgi:hypothetical protein
MKENYKLHLDFDEVKVLSDLDAAGCMCTLGVKFSNRMRKLHLFILSSEDEGMELYATWNKGWAKMSEDDKDSKNAKLQSSTILEEILRRVFSKDNPALAFPIQHARTKVPQDLLGVYALHIVREHFPQATLDVIVRDIIKVLMFSLQAPRCATIDEWHRKFM